MQGISKGVAVIILVMVALWEMHEAAVVPRPKKAAMATQGKENKNAPNDNPDSSRYQFQHPLKRAPLKTKPKPKPEPTRQMLEDAAIEAFNLKKIAEEENDRNLRQLRENFFPVLPIGANSTVIFVGSPSVFRSRPGKVNEDEEQRFTFDVADYTNNHFVSLFENGIRQSLRRDLESQNNTDESANKLASALHLSLPLQDFDRAQQIFKDEEFSFSEHFGGNSATHLVLILGQEVLAERQDMSNRWEFRQAVEKLLAHFRRLKQLQQIVLTGLFVQGENVFQDHPFHQEFVEWGSMLQQMAQDYEVAYVDLLTPLENFQRKVNKEQLGHSLLTTVDGKHLSSVGHAFFASQLLRAFHVAPSPELTGTVSSFVTELQADDRQQREIDNTISRLLSNAAEIVNELTSVSSDFASLTDKDSSGSLPNDLETSDNLSSMSSSSFGSGSSSLSTSSSSSMETDFPGTSSQQSQKLGAVAFDATEQSVSEGEMVFEL